MQLSQLQEVVDQTSMLMQYTFLHYLYISVFFVAKLYNDFVSNNSFY